MTETGDAVRRFIGGEEEAFSQIVRQWERRIYNLAWRMAGNREDAQDIVQEAFLSAFKSIRGLRDPNLFGTWLYQITLNHCRARRRSRSSDLSLNDLASDETGGDNALSAVIPAADRGDPVERLDIIQKALAGLSEEHRSAIVLKEYMGLSLEEVAGVMECPLSTAKSRLYHGLRGVQRNLKRLGIRNQESEIRNRESNRGV
jgi:RNA polymerase sigma-70 factor (ECF subfamily)